MNRPVGEANIRVRVKRKPRNVLRKVILMIIGVYFIFAAYGFVHDLVIAGLVKVELVKSNVIQNTIPSTGLLVRNETIITSPYNGKLKILVKEGERVRVGQVVAQVRALSLDSPNGEKLFNITAKKAGIVSFKIDGLEEIYTQKNLKALDLNKIETLKPENHQIVEGSDIESGKPVFRIINNLDPVYIVTSQADQKPFADEDSVLISWGTEGQSYRASIVERDLAGKKGLYLLSVSDYDNTLMILRKLDFKVITERYEGCVVPREAIIAKDGKDGIYTLYKERVKWKSIEVEGRVGEQVVVSGINPDTPVVINPELVKEGYPLKLP